MRYRLRQAGTARYLGIDANDGSAAVGAQCGEFQFLSANHGVGGQVRWLDGAGGHRRLRFLSDGRLAAPSPHDF